jgi:hypothetical protein
MLRKISPLLVFAALTIPAFAQKQPSAPRPQSPRQALIEVVTKGGDSVLKHLTVEVQEMFLKPENKLAAPFLTSLTSMKPEKGLEVFETGDVLFSYSEPTQHTKFEVHVDNDDMAGTEDTLLLSLHQFRDGKEEAEGFGLESMHFSVNLKQQQNVWRVNKISVEADFPVGDPEFIQKNFLKPAAGSAPGMYAISDVHGNSSSAASQSATMPPQQVLMFLGLAESTFARQHPETGFTCSLAALSETAKLMGVDHQVSSGTYNGYRFSLSRCEGKPAGSFQIVAEPLVAGKDSKTFCADATQNVRASEGDANACLAFGKLFGSETDDGFSGFHLVVPVTAPAGPK